MQRDDSDPPATGAADRMLVFAVDEQAARSVEDYCRELGVETRRVEGGGRDAVLEPVEEFRPSVVLIGEEAARQRGHALIQEIGATWPGVLCVVLSARDTAAAVIEALEIGACDFLRVPVDRDALVAMLRRCRRRAGSSGACALPAGGVVHEFNNSLSSILLFSDMATECVRTDPAEAIEHLAQITRAGERLAHLIEKLFPIDRPSSPDAS